MGAAIQTYVSVRRLKYSIHRKAFSLLVIAADTGSCGRGSRCGRCELAQATPKCGEYDSSAVSSKLPSYYQLALRPKVRALPSHEITDSHFTQIYEFAFHGQFELALCPKNERSLHAKIWIFSFSDSRFSRKYGFSLLPKLRTRTSHETTNLQFTRNYGPHFAQKKAVHVRQGTWIVI